MKNKTILMLSIILIFTIFIINLLYHENVTTFKISNVEYPYNKINYVGIKTSKSNRNIKVAIIDTGIDKNLSFYNSFNINEYNVTDSKNDNIEKSVHGTLVTSIICNSRIISDNNLQDNIEIISIKVGDDGNIQRESLIKGIQLAVDLDADIINVSVGTYHDDAKLKNVVLDGIKKDIIFVCSSGNDATKEYLYPASYENVISVTSLDYNNIYLKNNNRNSKICISAPGEKIPTYIDMPNGKYQKFLTGSSAATAIVTDVIIVLKETNSSLQPNDIIDLLSKTSKDLGDKGRDNYYGIGLIDFQKAVESANKW